MMVFLELRLSELIEREQAKIAAASDWNRISQIVPETAIKKKKKRPVSRIEIIKFEPDKKKKYMNKSGSAARADEYKNTKPNSIRSKRRKSKLTLSAKKKPSTILARCCFGDDTRLVHIPAEVDIIFFKDLITEEFGNFRFELQFIYDNDLITITKDEGFSINIIP